MIFSATLLAVFCLGVSARSYWVDLSCSIRVINEFIPEAKSMAQTAVDIRRTPAGVQIAQSIFPGATDAELDEVYASLQDFADATPVVRRESSNVRFHCNNDRDWVEAPDSEFPTNSEHKKGNRVWWDEGNQIIFNLGDPSASPGHKQEPGCRDGTTRGQTYCQSQTFTFNEPNPAGKTCRITLCDKLLPDKPASAGTTKFSFKDVGAKDFSERASNKEPKPSIDDYRMVSLTILHEWMHTINSPDYQDQLFPKSYGWSNIKAMGKALSLRNADSIAYIGLASKMVQIGIDSDPRKHYTFRDKDGVIQS